MRSPRQCRSAAGPHIGGMPGCAVLCEDAPGACFSVNTHLRCVRHVLLLLYLTILRFMHRAGPHVPGAGAVRGPESEKS
eukprot:7281511-Prymnesium_polylepis.2